MTRPRKGKSTEYVNPGYLLHDPHKPELSRQQQNKRFEKLKKLESLPDFELYSFNF
jgi:hypothetical protein